VAGDRQKSAGRGAMHTRTSNCPLTNLHIEVVCGGGGVCSTTSVSPAGLAAAASPHAPAVQAAASAQRWACVLAV
jgi:ferredoxin